MNEELREMLLTLLLDIHDMAMINPERFTVWQKLTISSCVDQLRAMRPVDND